MKIKVCDALCGSGKTLSCLNMINSDTENKYIFITPYLDEVERVKSSCVGRGFVSPEKNYGSSFSKLKDIKKLISAGKNIVSTHALFASYTDEIKELLREQRYVLVLDEVIDLFQAAGISKGDVDFLKRNNIAREEGTNIIWEDDKYKGGVFSEIKRLSQARDMIDYDGSFYFWALPADVFNCFSQIYVLTYLFEYQVLKYFFDANGIEYELIGTTKKNGTYQFCPLEEMDRKRDLRNKIHIIDSQRLNEIGDKNYSLSSGWFDRASREKGQPNLEALRGYLRNIFRHKDANADNNMWTTLSKYKNNLKGKGYSKCFLPFNTRASNGFMGRHHLAYCLNLYMMPWIKNYLYRIGAENVSQDMYALSMMVQWIFRSGIRNGDNIRIYVPSCRMRFLLQTWLDNLAKGNDMAEIKYNLGKVNRIGAVAYQIRKAKKNNTGGDQNEDL